MSVIARFPAMLIIPRYLIDDDAPDTIILPNRYPESDDPGYDDEDDSDDGEYDDDDDDEDAGFDDDEIPF